MSFTPNIPLPGQSLGQTNAPIRDNFTNYNTVVSVNHVAPNDSSGNQGKHKFVQMPSQTVAPATAAAEIATYVKTVAGNTRLWMRQPTLATEIKLSGIDPLAATSGYTFLPGGILMQWGQKNNPGIGGSVTFPEAFDATPYTVVLTMGDKVACSFQIDQNVPPISTKFNYAGIVSANAVLYWMAIGPKA